MLSRPSFGHAATVVLRGRGFTLIELMITVAVLAVSLGLAAPSFVQTMANYRVRSAAESMINGLNYARGEAVRRNSAVSFTLNVTGSGWSVDQVSPALAIQSRSGGDSPGIATTSSSASRVVTFLPIGQVNTTGVRLSQITVSSPTPNVGSRRIDILGGGLIRMCDPSVTTANDPRRC